MTIQEVIDRIIAFHPDLGERLATTCDVLKYGDPTQECTGIASAIYASPKVIEKAHAAGCNLLLVHEPAFYSHMDEKDWLENNTVYNAKKKLLDDYKMVIFRDHDRIHSHKPDGIFYGLVTELGWQAYVDFDWMEDKEFGKISWTFTMPGIPVREIAELFIEKLHLNNVRIIGNPETVVKTAALGAHLFPGNTEFIKSFDEGGYDLLIPGEYCDWEIAEYFKDAGDMGMNKAMLQLGHFNWEELGMKHAVTWLSRLVDYKIPVVYCCNEDMYNYVW